MLYSDSERRITDIIKMANLFKKKGYPKTSSQILGFIDILKGSEVPKDFLEKLDSFFELFQKEFVESLPIGQNYRKRCFEEIKETVFKAIGRMFPNISQAMLMIYPFAEKLKQGRKITGSIAVELANKTIKDKNVIFHLYCYAYLIIVEGIFEELARMLYFFKVIKKNSIPNIQDLKKLRVWDILKKIKSRPVFLEGWEEKKSIRNAIGHAQAYYDPSKNEIQFIDEPANYRGTMTMNQFMEKTLELEDSVATFTYIIILLRLYDLIVSTNPY